MTDVISLQRATPMRSMDAGSHKASIGTSAPAAESAPMSAATLSALTEAVAGKMLAEREGGEGRTGAAPIVHLRESTIPLDEASEMLAGIISKLPLMLSALTGGQDPIQAEEGAGTRAAEGAAVQTTARSGIDAFTASSSVDGVTGVDADIGDRSANVGAWLASSPFSNLLAVLRQLLLKFEKIDRDNSAEMVIMQRKITEEAGDKGVEKSREAFGGALGAALVTGGIGLGGMWKAFEGTSMKTNSADVNAMHGNKLGTVATTTKNAYKGTTTPTADMRGARGTDGKATAMGTGDDRPSSALQADADVDLTRMRADAQKTPLSSAAKDVQGDHPETLARAENPNASAMMLNMMAPGVGATVSAGVQIEAEMTEAKRQLALQVADVFRRIADQQSDQAANTRSMRDAAAQLYESLLNLVSSTSAHIISKF